MRYFSHLSDPPRILADAVAKMYSIMSALLVGLALCFVAGPAMAQDPAKVAPKNVKVLLENERVRVLEVRIKPGEKEPMHQHPAYVAYYFTPFKVKATLPDGKTIERERKAGEVVWNEPVTHMTENVGTTEAHVLLVELKEPQKKR